MESHLLAGKAHALLVMTGKRLERYADESLREVGLSAAQFALVRILWQQDGLTLGELSQACSCAPPNVTGLVDRLEKKGLLRRTFDPQDRRVIRIFLTDEGQKLREPAAQVVRTYLASFELFETDELQALIDLLTRFYRRLEGAEADSFLETLDTA